MRPIFNKKNKQQSSLDLLQDTQNSAIEHEAIHTDGFEVYGLDVRC